MIIGILVVGTPYAIGQLSDQIAWGKDVVFENSRFTVLRLDRDLFARADLPLTLDGFVYAEPSGTHQSSPSSGFSFGSGAREGGRAIWVQDMTFSQLRQGEDFTTGYWIRPKGPDKVNPLLFSESWKSKFGDSIKDDVEAIVEVGAPDNGVFPPRYSDQARARYALDDLTLKGKWVSYHSRDAQPPDPWVRVTVHTIGLNGKEVAGCQVFYVSAPFAEDDRQNKNHPYRVRFDKYSSPTTQRIRVGKYFIWAICGKKEAEPDRFDVGDEGETQKDVDVGCQP